MKQSYWLQRWRDNEIGFNLERPHTFLQKYFSSLSLQQNATILVPLCGKSVDLLWLAQQSMHVIGCELSEKACVEFFTEHGVAYNTREEDGFKIYTATNITLYAGDFFSLNQAMIAPVDAIYDRAAIIALPKEMRQTYAMHLRTFINPHTQMMVITVEYEQSVMPGPPFSVCADELNQLYGDALSVQPLYRKEIEPIPERFQQKGLQQAVEQIFLLNVSGALPS